MCKQFDPDGHEIEDDGCVTVHVTGQPDAYPFDSNKSATADTPPTDKGE